jgi:hypothetical protein
MIDDSKLFIISAVTIIMVVIAIARCQVNSCNSKSCPNGLQPTLVHNKCICAVLPK